MLTAHMPSFQWRTVLLYYWRLSLPEAQQMMAWVCHFGSREGSPWPTVCPSNPSLGHHLHHRVVIDLITTILIQKRMLQSDSLSLSLRNMAIIISGLSLLNGGSLEGTLWPLTEICGSPSNSECLAYPFTSPLFE